MKKYNLTVMNEFILMGITDRPELQAPLFGLFLVIYMTSMVGNLGIIILTTVDPRLQTPMYFFLRHLAITDLGYATAVGPKIFFHVLIGSELFILSAMSYDRYVAICNPLLYTWQCPIYCTFVSLLVTVSIFTSSFCGHNVINHFYCDCIPWISLLCSNTQKTSFIVIIFAAFDMVVSYLLLLIAILRMNSAEGRHKAFSTCGSHLTVVTVFHRTLIFMDLQPKSSHSTNTDKVSSIFYTLIIPMLNPLIYSLTDKDAKLALQRSWVNICNMFS
uniref:Olfactory receptor n=1 Tax=Nannospalax galili TaxID=1026970 RepID=A0A8C6QCR6_NANGA